MKRNLLIRLCLVGSLFTGACSGQSSVWVKVESAEAGFVTLFPCKPEFSKRLFQKEPKEANVFSYKCNFEGINFSVSLPERFEEFDPIKVEEELDGIEEFLKTSIGSNAEIIKRDLEISDYISREFEVESGNVYGLQLNIAHPRGIYGVQAFGKYATSRDKARVEEIIRKFITSFKLVGVRK